MPDEHSGLDEYAGAFARYLRTGTVGALREFCAPDADLVRLRIYRNGFIRTCIEALRASYPSVERLVGEGRFTALARPYVEACPPRVATLVQYGAEFPGYIEDTRDTHGLDHLASFAMLDRAWTEVHFSEDDRVDAAPHGDALAGTGTTRSPSRRLAEHAVPPGPFGSRGCAPIRGIRDLGDPDDPDNLGDPDPGPSNRDDRPAPGARTAPDPAPCDGPSPPAEPPATADAEALLNLRGRLSPWARLVSLDYRVLDAWSRLRQGALEERTEVRRSPQQVLIWRRGADMRYRDLTRPEHAFIAGVAVGRSCAEAAGTALEVDAGFDLVATFASVLHHRILSFEH